MCNNGKNNNLELVLPEKMITSRSLVGQLGWINRYLAFDICRLSGL